MKKFLYFFLVIPFVFLGVVFTYWNHQSVTLNSPITSYEIYLPGLLIGVFLLGMLVGYVVCFLSSIKVRRKLRAANKEVKARDASV